MKFYIIWTRDTTRIVGIGLTEDQAWLVARRTQKDPTISAEDYECHTCFASLFPEYLGDFLDNINS